MRGCRSGAAGSCTAEQPERSRRGVRRQRRRRNCCRCTGCTPKATSGPGAIRASPATAPGPCGPMPTPPRSMPAPWKRRAGSAPCPRREVLAVAEALGDACELTASYDRSRQAYAQARRRADEDVSRPGCCAKRVCSMSVGAVTAKPSPVTPGASVALPTAARWPRPNDRSLTSPRPGPAHGRAATRTAGASRPTRPRRSTGTSQRCRSRSCPVPPAMITTSASAGPTTTSVQGLRHLEELGDLVGQGNALNNLGIAAYYRGEVPGLRRSSTTRRAVAAR